jgi:hypothetical protein
MLTIPAPVGMPERCLLENTGSRPGRRFVIG